MTPNMKPITEQAFVQIPATALTMYYVLAVVDFQEPVQACGITAKSNKDRVSNVFLFLLVVESLSTSSLVIMLLKSVGELAKYVGSPFMESNNFSSEQRKPGWSS